ncbi:hypothetical protein N9M61_02570 [Gammaproteobacteria bacterium]|nr:hypothetical protein [Gammaproteobacteria bacterium]MDA8798895.1 hypothetical protein [Gammaproteobacteria bacterium]MDC0919410.1 hypothetical protein [Gammaproteobacteria bacterium]
MKNSILFFPSHAPTQYEALAKNLQQKQPDIAIKFFLLDKPYSDFSFDYVTYEELIDSCDELSSPSELNEDLYNCNLNDLFLMDRVHKKGAPKRELLSKYLFSFKQYLVENSITHVFGYALSDSITYGCYHVCQNLGIKYYYVNVTRLSTLYHLSSSLTGEGETSSLASFSNDEIFELVDTMVNKKITPDYASDPNMVIKKSYIKVLQSAFNLLKTRLNVKNKYLDFYPSVLLAIKRFLNRRLSYKELMRKTHDYDAFKDKKYFFYPLHLHPETATLVWGRWLNNQYEILKLIARVLPNEYILIVKEHKVAAGRHRRGFYDKIADLPKTILVDHETNAHDIISSAKAVVTISGTAGFEALCHNKPVLLFGDVDYKCMQNAIQCTDLSKIRFYVNKAINMETIDIHNDKKFIDYIRLKLNGSVSLDGYSVESTDKKLIEDLTSLYLEKLY